MSKKKLDISVLIILILFGGYYIYVALNLSGSMQKNEVGPGFFPLILGVALIAFSLIGLLKWFKKDDEKISFGNNKRVLYSIFLIVLFLLCWKYIGYFYVLSFIFIFLLFTIYRLPLKLGMFKLLGVNFIVSLALITFIYVLFTKLMYIDF